MKIKKTSLSEKLPRKIKVEEICCVLDNRGNRCKNQAVVENYYFGDRECETVGWVRVAFCNQHDVVKKY